MNKFFTELKIGFIKILREIVIFFLVYIVIVFLVEHVFDKEPAPTAFETHILSYLDSVKKSNNALKSKIDSLDLLKKEQLNVYYKTKWKYDTLKITIDTMPPLDATKLLLSKSRQLTSKGIE